MKPSGVPLKQQEPSGSDNHMRKYTRIARHYGVLGKWNHVVPDKQSQINFIEEKEINQEETKSVCKCIRYYPNLCFLV